MGLLYGIISIRAHVYLQLLGKIKKIKVLAFGKVVNEFL